MLTMLTVGLMAVEVVPYVGNMKGSISTSYVHSESPIDIFRVKLDKLPEYVEHCKKLKEIEEIVKG